MKRSRTLAGVCVALAAATAAVVWWLAPQAWPGAVDQRPQAGVPALQHGSAAPRTAARPMDDSFLRPAAQPTPPTAPTRCWWTACVTRWKRY